MFTHQNKRDSIWKSTLSPTKEILRILWSEPNPPVNEVGDFSATAYFSQFETTTTFIDISSIWMDSLLMDRVLPR